MYHAISGIRTANLTAPSNLVIIQTDLSWPSVLCLFLQHDGMWGEWLTSRLGCFTPWVKIPQYLWNRKGFLGCRANLDILEMRNVSCHLWH